MTLFHDISQLTGLNQSRMDKGTVLPTVKHYNFVARIINIIIR